MLIHQLATIMQKIKQIQYLNDTLSLIKRNFTGTCIHCPIAINNYFLEFGLFILVVWVFVFIRDQGKPSLILLSILFHLQDFI